MNLVSRVVHRIDTGRRAWRYTVDRGAFLTHFSLPLHVGRTRPCHFRFRNIRFVARPIDWVAVEEILLDGEYDFIQPVLIDVTRPVVVDLGANIGMFSLMIGSWCPSALIYSVEPTHSTYAILERNRLANSHLKWHTYQAAIWNCNGEISFDSSGAASTGARVASIGNERVSSITLATLLQQIGRAIDIMKIDIEGAEEVALVGNEDLLRSVGTVIIEIHPKVCNQAAVIRVLSTVFDFIYRVPGRRSTKPLLVASHRSFDLPEYRQ